MCAAASASYLSTFAPASGRFAPLHLSLNSLYSLHSHPYNYHLDFYRYWQTVNTCDRGLAQLLQA